MQQELAALSAAGNDRLRLIGVQKHRMLVAAGEVLALVDAVGLIFAAVVGDIMVFVLVPRGGLPRRGR